MPCGALCITENVLLVIFSFAMPFYIFLLCILFKYRKTDFSTSFFKIFISLGIADIIDGVLIYFTQKALFWGWWTKFFLNNQWLANVSLFVEWTAHFAQLNGVFLLTINRYVAIVHPVSFQAWFNSRNTLRFIGLQWVLALVFVTPRPFMEISYKLQDDNQTLYFDLSKTTGLIIKHFIFLTFVVLLDCLVVTLLYSRMMYVLWRNRHQVQPIAGNNATNSNVELRLAFIGLTIAVTLFLYSLHYLRMVIGAHLTGAMADFITIVLAIVPDVFTECNPFLLVLFCTDVRVKVMEVIGCAKPPQPQAGANRNNRTQRAKT